MSLVEQDGRDELVGNGSNKAFVYTFRILSKNEIEYLEDGVAKTVDTDFTVSGIGDAGGGTVTATVAPANLVAVTLLRKQGIDQDSVYQENENFPATRIEQDLDKLAMIAQMLAESIARAAKVPKESTASEVDLPDPSLTANRSKILRINAAGDAYEAVSASDLGLADGSVITGEGGIVQGGGGGVPEELARSARGDLLVQLATKLGWLAKGLNKQYVKSNGTDPVYDYIIAVKESGGTVLDIGAIADGETVIRTGAALVGTSVADLSGEIKLWPTATAPSGWLLLDGTERNATTFEDLFDVFSSNLTVWGTGTKTGNVVTDFATDDKIDLTAHGLDNNEVVHFTNTGGGLPAGLSINTKYYVINKTANDFEVSLTLGGGAVDITSDGTGTHHVHETFAAPDMRGRMPIGVGTGVGLSARALAATGGAETHQLTEAELAAHDHTYDKSPAIRADIGGGAIVTATLTSTASGSTGGDTAHENMSPFIALNYIIRT